MSKKILGVVAGLLVWLIVVMVVGEIMRQSWPAYASVARSAAANHIRLSVFRPENTAAIRIRVRSPL